MIKEATGMTFKRYAPHAKIRLADKLMSGIDMNATELAAYLGFRDLSHFIKTYDRIKQEKARTKELL